jgi:hypothetical protein
VTTEYKEFRVDQDPLDETLIDLMMIQGTKTQNDGVAPGQILDADLFWWFLLTAYEFWHDIRAIGKVIF